MVAGSSPVARSMTNEILTLLNLGSITLLLTMVWMALIVLLMLIYREEKISLIYRLIRTMMLFLTLSCFFFIDGYVELRKQKSDTTTSKKLEGIDGHIQASSGEGR